KSALNYGGRTEIVDACRSLAHDVVAGRLTPEQIDEETLGSRLGTAGTPDPDLLIRTSGEMRVSNFLLWQIAYSEIWVTPTLWPDFPKRHLFEAILDFQKREDLAGRPVGVRSARREDGTPRRQDPRHPARRDRSGHRLHPLGTGSLRDALRDVGRGRRTDLSRPGAHRRSRGRLPGLDRAAR